MTDQSPAEDICDLLIVGGGINGCGIARDAAGRGLRVTLCERDDLASATSSASTKLFHGGLRYLEYFELRLVRESLREREVLLGAMPHISWPMRFVLPYHPEMRFDSDTPATRVLRILMPWMRGRRPAWMIRLGLLLYDRLGARKLLPPTSRLDLPGSPEGAPLQARFRHAFEYSDCWVEDSRLVVLNARDAQARGARILTRAEVMRAHRMQDHWKVEVADHLTGQTHTLRARMLVNAAGPWVGEVLAGRAGLNSADKVRLVRGSHIVTRRLFEHDKAYFFQGADGRIIFAIPYEGDFTLIGTTDLDHPDLAAKPVCTPEEEAYLCTFASRYFRVPVTRDDIVWTYSGVRPLHDDGASSATAATRDYTLKLEQEGGAPMLNIFGGKITTYRRLAEAALERIGAALGGVPGPWTAGVPLPGGDFAVDGVDALRVRLAADYQFLTPRWAQRLIRAYGTEAWDVLGRAGHASDLGQDFGASLTEREVRWLMAHEFVRSAEDILWRRSKLGLRLSLAEDAALESWIQAELQREEGIA